MKISWNGLSRRSRRLKNEIRRGYTSNYRTLKVKALDNDILGNRYGSIELVTIKDDVANQNEDLFLKELRDISTKENNYNFIPLDPSKYIFMSRKLDEMEDQTFNNAENVLNKEDPIFPFDFKEIFFKSEVMDFAMEAMEKRDSMKKDISQLLKEEENENSFLEKNHFELILNTLKDNPEDKEALQKWEKITDNIFDPQNKKYNDEEKNLNMIILGLGCGSTFFTAPTEAINRIALASNISVEEMLKATLEFYNHELPTLKKEDLKSGKNLIQGMLHNFFYEAILEFRTDYLLSIVSDVSSNEGKDCTLYVSEVMGKTIERKIQNFDLHNYEKITKIYGLSTEAEVERIAERHGYLDAILGERFWESGFLTNKFPYIALDEREIKEEFVEVAKLNFYKGFRKGEKVIEMLENKSREMLEKL